MCGFMILFETKFEDLSPKSRPKFLSHNLTYIFLTQGANDKRYNPKLYGADKLCGICAGPGQFKCSRTNFEPYYGYQGAFKCMKDGAGDVAFIKESIVMALSPEDQAKYKLLCPDNTVKGTVFYTEILPSLPQLTVLDILSGGRPLKVLA